MLGVYMTCTVTYGNGAVIGMAITQVAPKPTLQEQVRDLNEFTEEVAGPAFLTAAWRRTETTCIQATALAVLAFALFLSIN